MRTYIVLHSDIFDLAYSHGNFGGLRFSMAHELGHAKCGHISLWRLIYSPVMTLLFLSKSTTRTQEYTDEYFHTVDAHKDSIWLRFANFRADHAVGFRLMRALHRNTTEGLERTRKML